METWMYILVLLGLVGLLYMCFLLSIKKSTALEHLRRADRRAAELRGQVLDLTDQIEKLLDRESRPGFKQSFLIREDDHYAREVVADEIVVNYSDDMSTMRLSLFVDGLQVARFVRAISYEVLP